MSRYSRALAALAASALAAALLPGGAAADEPIKPPPAITNAVRWTAPTPDEMVDLALARARRGGHDGLAALMVAYHLDELASFGKAREGLASIAKTSSPLADDAKWLGLRLLPSPAEKAWTGMRNAAIEAPADPDGLVRALAILGPFHDTGGGLMRREGPEAKGHSFSDMTARYAWGVYDVAWRRALLSTVTARGVPLDLYISPRTESCTYVASRVTLPSAQTLIVRVAASGTARLTWDAADVAASEEVHGRAVLDRFAAKIEAKAGDHLVAVKVCSAALHDEGRVRIRFTDPQNKPVTIKSSSDLSPLSLTPPAVNEADDPAADDDTKGLPKKGGPSKPPLKKAEAPKKKDPAKKGEPPKKAEAPKKGKPGPRPKTPVAEDDTEGTIVIKPPPGVTIVQTSLDQATTLGDPPPASSALAAAIVRIFAGADDLRSPRGPGLLDRVAGPSANSNTGTPVSVDELAMAGWVSPFGANRSGWLNLAWTRARAEKDAAAAAFAQRRLIASHLNTRYVDWAVSSLNEEPIRSAADPEAVLLRAIAKTRQGGGGLARTALEDLDKLEEARLSKTPIAVLAELFELSRTDRRIHLRIAKRLAESRADARGPSYASAFRTLDAAAYESAVAEIVGAQTSADALTRMGRELLDSGRATWARELFYTGTQLSPNRASAFAGLAAARRAILEEEQKLGKKSSDNAAFADAALRRAHDLDPGDASLKAEIAMREEADALSAPGAPGHGAQPDEMHIVKPDVFLARAKAKPVKKGEIVDRQLHWVRVVTYHRDKRVSQLMHYAREVVIEPRTENDHYENVPSEGDDTEILLAKVHRKDGSVALPEEQQSGGRRPMVRWPELKTGDVVEIAVRSWTSGPVGRRGEAPFYFIDYVGSSDTHPILYNEVVVEAPENATFAVDVLNGKPDRTLTDKKGGNTITRYIWDNPPSVPEEPLAPKLTETLPVVVGSTFAGWADFREWYKAAVKGFTEPDDQVKRLAQELTKGKASREAKLQAIFEYVADDIRYVNYVSGEWWLPNRPQELLARRQGDCDDKAMLLITLLKAIGIEATEVLVQTRYTAEPSLLRSKKVAVPVFDHGIAYLPGQNGKPGIWLDATSPESRLGPLPSMDSRALAFFIDRGPPEIIETPASSPEEHGLDAAWTITLSPSGAGDLEAEETHSGDSAFELRTALKQPDTRGQWVEQYLAAGWFPTVELRGDVDFTPDLPKGRAILGYGARSEGIARREGNELVVSIAEASTLTSQLAPLVKRTLPVVLPPRLAPGHDTRVITIAPPDGYTFAELPPNGEEQGGEFGKARVEFKKVNGKNAVTVTRTVLFDMSTIPVDKYTAWRGFLQRTDALMHRVVRLVPDEKAKAPALPSPRKASTMGGPKGGPPKPPRAAVNVSPAPKAPAKGPKKK